MTVYDTYEIQKLLSQRLDEYRYVHSLGVALSARELAKRYGADADRAYFAGLVHDITKNTPRDEQLRLIAGGGVALSLEELNNPKLWHAISGSIYVRDVLKINDSEIVSAVRYHTTGRDEMTLLEKIIYIADFISAERSFNGVEYMRKLAFESLDKAAMYAVKFCIPDLVMKGQVLHTDSVKLYNGLVRKGIKPKLSGEE